MFLHVRRGERRVSDQTRNMGRVNSVLDHRRLFSNRTFKLAHHSVHSPVAIASQCHSCRSPASPHPHLPHPCCLTRALHTSSLLPSPVLHDNHSTGSKAKAVGKRGACAGDEWDWVWANARGRPGVITCDSHYLKCMLSMVNRREH